MRRTKGRNRRTKPRGGAWLCVLLLALALVAGSTGSALADSPA